MTTPPTKSMTAEGDMADTVAVPKAGATLFRRFLAFAGPGYMVSVGYMDPGNWATSLAGGSKFGYTLLSVILVSNLMAILLQSLCARLGIGTGLDLAQACRSYLSRPASYALWFVCELAIIACDLAEVIGTAIALKLLFKIPLIFGALITALDAFLLLYLMQKDVRRLEAFIIVLLVTIMACFAVQIAMVSPSLSGIAQGFFQPTTEIFTNHAMLYLAIGILGATVMPHNLYLHSSLVKTRNFEKTEAGRWQAIRWATLDSTLALMLALFVNAGILIIAAGVFYTSGNREVADIEQAYQLLTPAFGTSVAATLFAIALLASGLNSTLTTTLAGQIVMDGFLNLRIAPWLRRLVTRGLAIIPVIIIIALYGEKEVGKLLIFSQIILSMQLPFAVIPLVAFVSSRKKMGVFVAPLWLKVTAWGIAAVILTLNIKLLFDIFTQ